MRVRIMYSIPIMLDQELIIGSGMIGELKASCLWNCLNWSILLLYSSKYLIGKVDVMFSKYAVTVEILPFAQYTVLLGKLTVYLIDS
jgi:hypothetical protein